MTGRTAPEAGRGAAAGAVARGVAMLMGVSSVPVHQVLDRKGPLKGKGELARWRREAADAVCAIHQQMAALAQETRAVEGRRWNLCVHRQRGDARQLRWRAVDAQRLHQVWTRIEPELGQLAPALAQWYVEAQAQREILNHRERLARFELKTLDHLLRSGAVTCAHPTLAREAGTPAAISLPG